MSEYPLPPLKTSLCRIAVQRSGGKTRLSSLSASRGECQRSVSQSRRDYARRLRLLRLLRALRLHDRSESAAHQYASSGARPPQDFHHADRMLGATRGS